MSGGNAPWRRSRAAGGPVRGRRGLMIGLREAITKGGPQPARRVRR